MTEATTWENIANLILSELEHLKLLISKLRGQSYDSAANMSGKCNGVNIIETRQPLAFYTHCGDHRTNLIAYSLDNNINIRKTLNVFTIWYYYMNKLYNSVMYIILIITKQIH